MSSVSFIKFDRQSLKWARFGTVADQSYEFRVPVLFKVESREFSCHAFIGFVMGLFIPLWLYQQEIRLSHSEKGL